MTSVIVYFSAKGFEDKIEQWLHGKGILTTDLENWEGGRGLAGGSSRGIEE